MLYFKAYYGVLFDLHLAEIRPVSQDSDTALAGASIVLSVKLFQEMVDIFGDVPYSQAFNNNKYTTPAYDKSQDIYNSLLLSLDTAITYLSYPVKAEFTSADIINKGDEGKWIRFANTLRLRLLIRQSQVLSGCSNYRALKLLIRQEPPVECWVRVSL